LGAAHIRLPTQTLKRLLIQRDSGRRGEGLKEVPIETVIPGFEEPKIFLCFQGLAVVSYICLRYMHTHAIIYTCKYTNIRLLCVSIHVYVCVYTYMITPIHRC
jgi:hypothetical protein